MRHPRLRTGKRAQEAELACNIVCRRQDRSAWRSPKHILVVAAIDEERLIGETCDVLFDSCVSLSAKLRIQVCPEPFRIHNGIRWCRHSILNPRPPPGCLCSPQGLGGIVAAALATRQRGLRSRPVVTPCRGIRMLAHEAALGVPAAHVQRSGRATSTRTPEDRLCLHSRGACNSVSLWRRFTPLAITPGSR